MYFVICVGKSLKFYYLLVSRIYPVRITNFICVLEDLLQWKGIYVFRRQTLGTELIVSVISIAPVLDDLDTLTAPTSVLSSQTALFEQSFILRAFSSLAVKVWKWSLSPPFGNKRLRQKSIYLHYSDTFLWGSFHLHLSKRFLLFRL